MSSICDLSALTYESCRPCLPLEEGSLCKVLKCIDGDSFYAGMLRASGPVRLSCRLRSIDSPEIRSHSAPERAAALQAKAKLQALIEGKLVVLVNVGIDKFGRVLTDAHELGTGTSEDVATQLLQDTGLFRPYHGEAKKPWVFEA